MELSSSLCIGIFLVAMVSSVSATALTFSSYDTYSGSIWNDNHPDRALTSDDTSCYMSGREETSFWKMRFPETVTVAKVNVTGDYSGSLMLRVGFDHSDVGKLDGHQSNLPCRELTVDGPFNEVFECSKERVGNVISINGETADPKYLILCNIEVY